MAVALSPWPTGEPAATAATERLQRLVLGRTAHDSTVTDHLGATAAALVEREAPNAPQAVKDEAVVRFAGYWSQADFGTIAEEETGPKRRQYVVNHAGAFRRCGAQGLLSPWKVRRAGAIPGKAGADD